eukprot:gb/GECG01013909.1/.p1 GENE.gb/GECG01013909.1/~~gb/GECG01013909.1/.p1  ORF type:complete len:253 (+),score=35.12 gb/GECG01013909.1/:1-759(+)
MAAVSSSAAATESNRAFKALVTGSTGAIGKHLVAELLIHPEKWSRIVTVGRRPFQQDMVPEGYTIDVAQEEKKGRLEQIQANFDQLEQHKQAFQSVDASLCCLGTTRSDAGGAEGFRRVDLEFVTNIARASKEANVRLFSHVTASNAKKNSWLLYPQVKGQVQERIADLHFPYTSIFQPGLLDRGGDKRTVEKIAGWIVPSIHVKSVAQAIRKDAEATLAKAAETKEGEESFKFVDVSTMKQLSKQADDASM